jgi:2-polyprenyl-3-methyl-5-hydroxy-6-metoxy-1,4-benzoquinol methylase
MLRRPAKAAIRAGLRQPRLRSFVEAELRGPRPLTPQESIEPGRTFIDRHGVVHELDPTLRDRLKPGWRIMVDPDANAQPPTDEALAGRARKAARSVREAGLLVQATAGARLGGRVLEVGCYDGAVAFQLAKRPDTRVVASDLARYYVDARPGIVDEDQVATDIDAQGASLARLRERARLAAAAEPGSVEFIEDDITDSAQPDASFDVIVSYEVLEHVRRPDAAFAAMARLLRPGGIAYHDYNPFFAANGGHSMCTLAIPWGHARLGAADFRRYLEELRPTEVDQAMRFYEDGLNRMTLADLRHAVEEAGLELVAMLPWNERKHTQQLTPAMLAEVRRNHPSATIQDLLATFVSVIARRPG